MAKRVYIIANHTGAIPGSKREGFAFGGYYQGTRINHIEAAGIDSDTPLHFGRAYLMKAEIDKIHNGTMKVTVSQIKGL